VAVATQQDTLTHLKPRFLERSGYAIESKVELLGSRIKMMELKNLLTAVIAADQAFTSGLFH
jgi:hypothetical protein